jgi:hypothetical protein
LFELAKNNYLKVSYIKSSNFVGDSMHNDHWLFGAWLVPWHSSPSACIGTQIASFKLIHHRQPIFVVDEGAKIRTEFGKTKIRKELQNLEEK